MKNTKKIVSLVLAICMLASLAISASAANTVAASGGTGTSSVTLSSTADGSIGGDPAHIRTVVPLPKNREEMKAVIREEIAHRGVSVIIPRRECIQTAKRHNAAKK